MKCAWDKLLRILPARFRQDTDTMGRMSMQELRLRINSPPEMVLPEGSVWLSGTVTQEDLQYVINMASQYSPWSAASIAQGFLTAPGGHRIGICGKAAIRDGQMCGFQEICSVCIRVARDHPGTAEGLENLESSVLIIGPPGWGKTTLLRDLIRQISQKKTVSVVDERGEIFPDGFNCGKKVDVLQGCSKESGVEILLRCMGPEVIAVDEITAHQDAQALIHAANCGVLLLATAHARSLQDLKSRTIYRTMLDRGIFGYILVLKRDKTYDVERILHEL